VTALAVTVIDIRLLNTVILNEKKKTALLEDIKAFLDYKCNSSTKGGLTEETLSRRCCIYENTKLKRKKREIFRSVGPI
jgi:hypothetical protein